MKHRRKTIIKPETIEYTEAKKYAKLIEEKGLLAVSADIQDILLRDYMVMYTRAVARIVNK